MYDFESHIVDIPDYPEPGVVFKDITPLFGNPEALKAMTDALAEHFAGMGITKVVGPEARGFMVGVPVAVALGAGEATGKLVRDMGAKLVGYGCILELAFLNPRKKLTPSNEDVELFSLVTVD